MRGYGTGIAQDHFDRFDSGEFRGFAKSSPEHIINEMDAPFHVRRIEGTVVCVAFGASVPVPVNDPRDCGPMPNALFEIRGPGTSMVVRGVKTDKAGRFKLKHVAPGIYRFKATFNAYQSVVGTVVIDKKGSSEPIRIGVQMFCC